MSEFGNMIRSLREMHNLTQKEVADRLSVHHTYVSKIEAGQIPSEKAIRVLATIFEFSPDELLGVACKWNFDKLCEINKQHDQLGFFLRCVQEGKLTRKHWRMLWEIIYDIIESEDDDIFVMGEEECWDEQETT